MAKFKINNTSQKLFLDILSTFPYNSKIGDYLDSLSVNLVAKGFKRIFNSGGDEEKQKYLAKCEKHKIIPFSSLTFSYKNGLLLPVHSQEIILGYNEFDYEQDSNLIFNSFVDNRNIHEYNIKVFGYECRNFTAQTKLIGKVLKEALESVIRKHYHINAGNIKYNYNHLDLNFDNDNGASLYYEGHVLEAGKWFRDLKEKYDKK